MLPFDLTHVPMRQWGFLCSTVPCFCSPISREFYGGREVPGTCIQGHATRFTHKNSLRFAVDFALPIGTPIRAARAGIVAALKNHFGPGKLQPKYKTRANYVAIRHEDGTYARYFHLQKDSVCIKRGDTVGRGDVLGNSGNSGYSAVPHLHFDVVDCLEFDNAIVQITAPCLLNLESSVAAFSGMLPLVEEPIFARVRLAEPRDASTLLKDKEEKIKGCVVLACRGEVDFYVKAYHAQFAGAVALLVYNNEKDQVIHTMAAPPSANFEVLKKLHIPVLMVSASAGAAIENWMLNRKLKVKIKICRSENFRPRVET